MIKKVTDIKEVLDFVWGLGQNGLYSSYPRKKSIEEVEKEIKAAIHNDNYNIIASYKDDVLNGVCIYFWVDDDNYAQTTEFLIQEDYEQIADKFIGYIRKELSGFEFLIGVPLTNQDANQYFQKRNIECIEVSTDTRLYNLNEQHNSPNTQVERLEENKFEEYTLFHDKHAVPNGMYFVSKNIKKYLNKFRIFVYRQEGEIHGSIFVQLYEGGAEIFGLFIDEEYKEKSIESMLIQEMLRELYEELGSIKEMIYFIDDNELDELKAAINAGFRVEDRYRCYKYVF